MKLLQLYYYEGRARASTGKPSSVTLLSVGHGFQETAATELPMVTVTPPPPQNALISEGAGGYF